MRPMSQLLTIIREYISEHGLNGCNGICGVLQEFRSKYLQGLTEPLITWAEANRIEEYLMQNRPFIGWFRSRFFEINDNLEWLYWWPRGKAKPRLRWLDKRIKIEIKKEMKLS